MKQRRKMFQFYCGSSIILSILASCQNILHRHSGNIIHSSANNQIFHSLHPLVHQSWINSPLLVSMHSASVIIFSPIIVHNLNPRRWSRISSKLGTPWSPRNNVRIRVPPLVILCLPGSY
uniref:NADH dehydrogenase n=1 Tax=Rhizophora mucronata TaxID=61149 RepID=A0A2P2JCT5_RHIMU